MLGRRSSAVWVQNFLSPHLRTDCKEPKVAICDAPCLAAVFNSSILHLRFRFWPAVSWHKGHDRVDANQYSSNNSRKSRDLRSFKSPPPP
mmetsp:Transcript_56286/g.148530  ORF Transcript_56286/g.148530 Transcript_56286/m.148530 type:complete len:90 (+) Transcript_56286:64-333(+)